MAKKRGLCCPCRVGAKKKACGLKGCGPGCSCGPCRAGVRGLSGTPAEHETSAAGYAKHARDQRRVTKGSCHRAVLALEYAVASVVEAGWVGGKTLSEAKYNLNRTRRFVKRVCPSVASSAPPRL